ncbi:copper amine oxidase N-terminal domain-containing protein [Paenibacillus alvei]|uniref:stalk domain-containing protein n=1 Tax=Paenibacillus alvei TaxID=44250 RepID=UPI00228197AC|nr:stalk domain-containing protein [Paenibacillus alvei]MCY9734175.1 copper amine oxidase N-terminal domain-containing protein [Paenibacillus alvei]
MKKWAYLLSGIAIGALVVSGGSAFADQITSLVGKKVTGEYTVVVNGKEIKDKGVIIEGKTNVPVRGMSQALGAEIRVEGKKVVVTTQQAASDTKEGTTKPDATGNKYMSGSKENIEEIRDSYVNRIIAPLKSDRDKKAATLAESEKFGGGELTALANEGLKKDIADLDAEIAKYEAELKLMEEALATKK